MRSSGESLPSQLGIWPCRPPHTVVGDRLGIAAVDPEPIGQIRPAEIGFALGVVTMAGDAIGREDGLARVDFRSRHFLCDRRIGKAAHVNHDVVDFVLLEQLIAPERHHLRAPGLRMRGIDADADGFRDAFGIATPKPRGRRQVRKSVAALRVQSMTRRAVVAEQRPAGLPHDLHQFGIGLDLLEASGLDAFGPDAAFESGLLQAFGDGVALVDAEQTLGVGHAERPRRHQYPVDDGEQGRHDQEEIDRPRHRRVQFLDAVPLMTGGHVAGMGIAFLYRHG